MRCDILNPDAHVNAGWSGRRPDCERMPGYRRGREIRHVAGGVTTTTLERTVEGRERPNENVNHNPTPGPRQEMSPNPAAAILQHTSATSSCCASAGELMTPIQTNGGPPPTRKRDRDRRTQKQQNNKYTPPKAKHSKLAGDPGPKQVGSEAAAVISPPCLSVSPCLGCRSHVGSVIWAVGWL